MEGERAVFTEETTPQTDVKLGASGDVDDTLLEALGDDVKRQRKRLQAKMRRAVGLARQGRQGTRPPTEAALAFEVVY